MQFTTEFDEANDLWTVRVSGVHKRPEDSIVLQRAIREAGREKHGGRFLVDMRGATIVGGVMDTFEVGRVPVDFGPDQGHFKVALVYAGSLETHRFMETVAVNRGFRIRIFDEMEPAFRWLESKSQPGPRPMV